MFKHRELTRTARVIALAIPIGLSGCATLVSLLEPNSPKIYGGTRMSLDARAQASEGETPAYGWTWYPLLLVDLPLSMVTDTVLLPVTILMEPDEASLRTPRVPSSTACEAASDAREREMSDSGTPPDE